MPKDYDVPDALDAAIRDGLQREAHDRGAGTVQFDRERFAHDTRLRARRRRRGSWTWSAAVAGLAVVLIGGSVVWHGADATTAHPLIPAVGGFHKRVDVHQLPESVWLSIQAMETFDSAMPPPRITQVTETQRSFVSTPLYHVTLRGTFLIRQALPHQRGQKFPPIKRLVLSIPVGARSLSLHGYAAGKKVYEKRDLPVIVKHWTFAGRDTRWHATYTVDSSAVDFSGDYAQATTSHYTLRYVGSHRSSIRSLSYTFTVPGARYSSGPTKFPPSGVIAHSAGQGGGLGALTAYTGEHGTLTVSWAKQHAVIRLNLSTPSHGGH